MIRSLLVLNLVWALGVSTATAGLVAESVLVVVNGDSPTSLAVANAYVHLRQIPNRNIVVLTGITNREQLPVDAFRTQILKPVLEAVQTRLPAGQIRCVTYSTDLPTAIDVRGDLGNRSLPRILTPVASINGLTFLYQKTLAADARYLELDSNAYVRRSGVRSNDTPWSRDEQLQYLSALQQLGLRTPVPPDAPADGLFPWNSPERLSSGAELERLAAAHPQSPGLLYHLAIWHAQWGRTDAALEFLRRAVEAGWHDARQARRDPNLQPLHRHTHFDQLLTAMQQVPIEVQPTRGFRSHQGWNSTGEPVATPQPRYLLSTVLGVTTGRGLSAAEVIAGLERSVSADGTRPPGTIYYMRNPDIRSVTREWGFSSAAAHLRNLGVDAEVRDGILPERADRVAGAMIGIADFDWSRSGSTILPGAIVEHLTSFGGVLTSGSGQTPLTEFLRHGAAGASGTVTEPYAIQAKFPDPFLQVHYVRGATLAEAFYSSVAGPYQLLVVGDPLCAPWKQAFEVTVETQGTEPEAQTVTLQPRSSGDVSFEWFLDGERQGVIAAGRTKKVDKSTLEPGRHEVSIVAFAADGLETGARWSGSIEVSGNAPRLTAHREGPMLKIQASVPGATRCIIHHLGRPIAEIEGAEGVAEVPIDRLGTGPVRLELLTRRAESATIQHAASLQIRLEPEGDPSAK